MTGQNEDLKNEVKEMKNEIKELKSENKELKIENKELIKQNHDKEILLAKNQNTEIKKVRTCTIQ